MAESKKTSYLSGAALLAATVAITKIVGFLYKIPLYNMLGDEGTTHFQVTYTIYSLLLTISTAGIPVAMSRLIASSHALGHERQARRYFRTGLAVFVPIGLIGAGIMLLFPQQLAQLMEDPEVTHGIMVLAPAVLFVCIISVYRGHSQGYSNMMPTAISQILEVIFKLAVGLPLAWFFLKRGANSATVSAGAIVGVTVGLGICIPVLIIYKAKMMRGISVSDSDREIKSYGATAKQILNITIPITLSSSIMNIFSLLDTKLILRCLQDGAGKSYEMAKILNGVYSKGFTLFNLPSAFIVPITVSVVPAISAAIARGNHKEARTLMESAMKVTNLLALPAGVGLAVLSYPIFNVLYPDSHELGPTLLMLLGIASYFVCTYLVTGTILQATGHERFELVTFLIGGIVKIAINWVLISDPRINIIGAPIGTIVCYIIITLLNILFICKKVKKRPYFLTVLVGPLFCTLVMGASAWATYGLLARAFGSAMTKMQMTISMAAAIIIAILVYGLLIVCTRTVTKRDAELLPKGDVIARILHLR